MTNPTLYKIVCPYCGDFLMSTVNKGPYSGTWECPECGLEFKPQPMPLDEYDKLWKRWQEEQADNG